MITIPLGWPAAQLSSSLPAFAVRAFDPAFEFGKVLYLHVGTVPFDFVSHACVLGQVAEEREFGEPRAVVETGLGLQAAGAAGVQKVGEDVLDPGKGARRLVNLLHLLE